MYHGWSDPGIPPYNAVNYYESVLKATPTRKPCATRCGCSWCRAWAIAAAATARARSTWLPQSTRGCETKAAPSEIPASKIADGKVVRTRPLCAYPAVATYKGTGSTDDAANFVCR